MMRPLPYLLAFALLAGCSAGGGISSYWDDVDLKVTESNYSAGEERFARFAELLVKAPEKEADKALEALLDRMKEDEVTYYVYSNWIESAFHNYFSPCRNPRIFGNAAQRFAEDGILSPEEAERLLDLAAKDRLNRPGEPCVVPEGAEADREVLYLVLNLDCRTCLQSLAALTCEHPEAEHIALCFGYSPIPEATGWKYIKPEGMDSIFELEAAPFWFLKAADGTVAIPYSSEFDSPVFARPE